MDKSFHSDEKPLRTKTDKPMNEVKGKIDSIQPNLIKGWAAYSNNPEKIRLSLKIDGEEKLILIADQFRGDLKKAGVNDGNHAFSINPIKFFSLKPGVYSILIEPVNCDLSLMVKDFKLNVSQKDINQNPQENKRLNLTPKQKEIRKKLQQSGLFDAGFYSLKNRDVQRKCVDPLDHYVKSGDKEGRDPNILFDTKFYREKYLDNSDSNCLIHYLESDANGQYQTCKGFDGKYYIENNRDLKKPDINPLHHYLKYGIREGRLAVDPKRKIEIRYNANIDKNNSRLLSNFLERILSFFTPFPKPTKKLANKSITKPSKNKTVKRQELVSVSGFMNAKPTCTIIIPVYNALNEVEACIKSVIKHTDLDKNNLIIMDDCSPDNRVEPMLKSFSSVDGIEIFRNEKNIGYTRNINRGISKSNSSDILLLNSDTIVTKNWLQKMQIAAYTDSKIGTVTAVSNNAGAFSVPQAGTNIIPEGITIDDMASLVSELHTCQYPDVPTGNGFCLYIKKDLLDSIGGFNEELFPRGYGEENDFCMRALRAGWRNIVDMKTYIYHVRTASFKEEKTQLIEKSKQILREKYPEYQALTKGIGASEVIKSFRADLELEIKESTASSRKIKPTILYVLSTMTGGTPQTNRDLMTGVSEKYDSYVLACDRKSIKIMKLEGVDYKTIEQYSINDPILFWQHSSHEYREIVASILFKYNIDLLHIRHIAWHDLSLPKIAKSLNIPVVYSLHDFYAACPSVNLIDKNAVYHPEGAIENAANPLWNDATCLPMNQQLHARWKDRMQESLSYADIYITTSDSAKEILQSNLPLLKNRNQHFHVIPHGRDFEKFENIEAGKTPSEYINILLPGNIGHSKGARLIKEIKEKDLNNKYRFHVLGKCTNEIKKFVTYHGPYERHMFNSRVRDINPDISAVLSIWPETYCHTLTESWAIGLPVLGVDLGAVGERIARHGGGWLAQPTAKSILEQLDLLLKNPESIQSEKDKVLSWQAGYGLKNNISEMSSHYIKLYDKII